jgi:HEPN domain-containing protein
VKKEVKNWVDSAEYDLGTAEHMLKAGRYVYCIFMCHLALEKVLKARVEQETGKTPPRTHNLLYLLNLTGLSGVEEEALTFVSELNNLSVVTRYPEDFQRTLEAFSEDRAKAFLEKTRRIFRWIQESIA